MPSHADPHPETREPGDGIAAAAIGLVTTLVTGAACVGPFVAIVLGVGGFGWLTRYAHLRVPASALTFVLLAYGFARVYGRRRRCGETAGRRERLGRSLLWFATALALAINVFEYLVLPRLS